jgi:hypothetical protein
MLTLQQVGCDVGNFLSKGLIIAGLTFSSIRIMLVVYFRVLHRYRYHH